MYFPEQRRHRTDTALTFVLIATFGAALFFETPSATEVRIIASSTLLAMAVFVTSVELLRQQGNRPRSFSITTALLCILALCELAAAAAWINPNAGVRLAIYFTSYGSLAWLLASRPRTTRLTVLSGMYILLLTASIAGILAVGGLLLTPWFDQGRLFGPIGYANTFAVLLGAGFWLGVWLEPFWKSLHLPMLRAWPFAEAAIMTALLWTESRATFVAFLLALGAYIALNPRWRTWPGWRAIGYGAVWALSLRWGGLAALILALGVSVWVEASPDSPITRSIGRAGVALVLGVAAVLGIGLLSSARSFTSLHTLHDRLAYWLVALQIWWAHPFGVGGGGWGDLYPGTENFAFYAKDAHSTWLQLALQTGLQGIVALIAYVWLHATRLFRHWRFSHRGHRRVAPLIGIMVLLAAHAAVDLDGSFMVWWLLAVPVMTCFELDGLSHKGMVRHSRAIFPACIFWIFGLIAGTAITASLVMSSMGIGLLRTHPVLAQKWLNRAIAVDPLSASSYLTQASADSILGEDSAADVHLKYAMIVRPYSARVFETVSAAWLRQDRPDRAWTAISKALSLSPYNVDLYQLALQIATINRQRNPQEAAVWRERCMDVDRSLNKHVQAQPHWITAREALHAGGATNALRACIGVIPGPSTP